MSCSPIDLKDYFLQELTDPQQRQVEAHIQTCRPCQEELAQLRLTEAALFALRDEEIPQRIAFVSDPVFEPSPWRRALSAFWNSGARLGFASAAMLSAALVFFAVNRPAPAPVVHVASAPAQTTAAAAPSISAADVQARIDAAVTKAVARQGREIAQAKADLEGARQRFILAEQMYNYEHRKDQTSLITARVMTPPGVGELK